MATGTPSPALSDLAALLSAADAQGRIDPAQLQAQRLLQGNRLLGGYDANGLVAGVVAADGLRGADQRRLIDAVGEQLPHADRARFDQALDAANVGEGPLRRAVEIGATLASAPAAIGSHLLQQADQGLSDTWARWRQGLQEHAAAPTTGTVAASADRLADGALEQVQFRHGVTRGLVKDAAAQVEGVVDLAKLGWRLQHDPALQQVVAGTVLMYGAQTLRDPTKPQQDAAKLGARLGMEWVEGLHQAQAEGKAAEYMGQAAGTATMEALLLVVPPEKIVGLARGAGLATQAMDEAAGATRLAPGLGAGRAVSAEAEQALADTLSGYMRAMQAADGHASTQAAEVARDLGNALAHGTSASLQVAGAPGSAARGIERLVGEAVDSSLGRAAAGIDHANDAAHALEAGGARVALQGTVDMAREAGTLDTLVTVARRNGHMDGLLRMGAFTPEELTQLRLMDAQSARLKALPEGPLAGLTQEQLAERKLPQIFKPDQAAGLSPSELRNGYGRLNFDEALAAKEAQFDPAFLASAKGKHVVGQIAEAKLVDHLLDAGYTDVVSLKNKSNHGIDLIARNPDSGRLEVYEVKGSALGRAVGPDKEPDFFLRAVLDRFDSKDGQWKEHRWVDPELDQRIASIREELEAGNVDFKGVKVELSRDPATGKMQVGEPEISEWKAPGKSAELTPSPTAPLLDQPGHRGHDLFQRIAPDIDANFAALPAEQRRNLAGALAAAVVADPLVERVDQVRANTDGSLAGAIYQPFGDKPPFFNARVEVAQAVQVPLEHSSQQVAQVLEQQQRDQALAQTQQLTPKGPILG